MRVVLGAAFESRLDEAVEYLLGVGADAAAQELLDHAYDALPELLVQSPRIGREFIAHDAEAPEVVAAWSTVRELLGDDIELREYIFKDYLALYAIHGDCIHLLTLRHHRQCGFNLLPEGGPQ
ncbi:MAG: type II toxin-antitoxin system RelE/ParE family toxin [Luteimonas sp.]